MNLILVQISYTAKAESRLEILLINLLDRDFRRGSFIFDSFKLKKIYIVDGSLYRSFTEAQMTYHRLILSFEI